MAKDRKLVKFNAKDVIVSRVRVRVLIWKGVQQKENCNRNRVFLFVYATMLLPNRIQNEIDFTKRTEYTLTHNNALSAWKQ